MRKMLKILSLYKRSELAILILVFLQTLTDLYLPTMMAEIVDKGVVNGDIRFILTLGGAMLLVSGVGGICSVVAAYYSARLATGFAKNLRSKLFSHVTTFGQEEFDKIGSSSLITRTTNDIAQLQQVLILMLRMMIMAPMMAIGGIIMAVYQDPQLSLVLVVALPILTLTIIVVARIGLPLYKKVQEKIDKLNMVVREGLTGIRVIRAFNRIEYERLKFDEANFDLTSSSLKVNRLMATLMPIMMLVLNISTIAIVWFGGIRIDQGEMQVGSLMAFIQYAMLILFSLLMFSFMFVLIPRASVSITRINEVLDLNPMVKDPSLVKKPKIDKGYIEFKSVTFSYPGAEKPALSNISFKAEPGQITAVIGGTGAGKSTLINLIPRFYDISSGSVEVDGVDIRDMEQETLRKKIGLVPQKSLLFTGTVAHNLSFGNIKASKEDMLQATHIAQATEFINNLKEGFDASVSQGGVNLSGGQKQRLAIARALVRKPKIYLFDDCFSALDYKTDANLRQALSREVKDSTIIIVSQRVVTVMDADQIIVLDKGQIVTIGKHRDLMKNCSIYREIVSSQLSEEEIG